jgi:hypothetical protein
MSPRTVNWVNCAAWLTNSVLWFYNAESTPMAVTSFVLAVVSGMVAHRWDNYPYS